jgi:hypothetical protein
MMKTAVIAVFAAFPLLAYGPGMLNLETPFPDADPGSIELRLNHRFYGAALKDEPLESFFGMDNGANVAVDLGWHPVSGLEVRAGHVRSQREYSLGGYWSARVDAFQAAFSLGYASVKPSANQDREGGLTLLGAFSMPFANDRVIPVVNYGYDGRTERHGPGMGLSVGLTDRTAIIGEFFPVVDRDDTDPTILPEDVFGFGVRYTTWGHQFVVCLGNSAGTGLRGQLNGASTNDLSVGFTVKRMF